MTKPAEYPLRWPDGWPRTKGTRKRGAFLKNGNRISYAGAEGRVLDQLRIMLKTRQPKQLICSSNVIRDREPTDPGVAVYFQKDDATPMRVIAIDLYDRAADNLAAVGNTLEALRAIERHGGAQILERAFTGFDALPAPSPWKVLEITEGSSEDVIDAAFRTAAKQHHPDVGGNPDQFARISAAREQCLKLIGAA